MRDIWRIILSFFLIILVTFPMVHAISIWDILRSILGPTLESSNCDLEHCTSDSWCNDCAGPPKPHAHWKCQTQASGRDDGCEQHCDNGYHWDANWNCVPDSSATTTTDGGMTLCGSHNCNWMSSSHGECCVYYNGQCNPSSAPVCGSDITWRNVDCPAGQMALCNNGVQCVNPDNYECVYDCDWSCPPGEHKCSCDSPGAHKVQGSCQGCNNPYWGCCCPRGTTTTRRTTTTTTTTTLPQLVCNNLRPAEGYTFNNLIQGDRVAFTCIDGNENQGFDEDNGPENSEFRYRIDDGSWNYDLNTEFLGWAAGAVPSSHKAISEELAVYESGDYKVQCRFERDDAWTPWGPPCESRFRVQEIPEVCNAQDENYNCDNDDSNGNGVPCDCIQDPITHAVVCDEGVDEDWTYKLYENNKITLDEASIYSEVSTPPIPPDPEPPILLPSSNCINICNDRGYDTAYCADVTFISYDIYFPNLDYYEDVCEYDFTYIGSGGCEEEYESIYKCYCTRKEACNPEEKVCTKEGCQDPLVERLKECNNEETFIPIDSEVYYVELNWNDIWEGIERKCNSQEPGDSVYCHAYEVGFNVNITELVNRKVVVQYYDSTWNDIEECSYENSGVYYCDITDYLLTDSNGDSVYDLEKEDIQLRLKIENIPMV